MLVYSTCIDTHFVGSQGLRLGNRNLTFFRLSFIPPHMTVMAETQNKEQPRWQKHLSARIQPVFCINAGCLSSLSCTRLTGTLFTSAAVITAMESTLYCYLPDSNFVSWFIFRRSYVPSWLFHLLTFSISILCRQVTPLIPFPSFCCSFFFLI